MACVRREKIYLDEYEATLDALRMILIHLGKMKGGSEDDGTIHSRGRAIPARAMRRACRLLNLRAIWEKDRTVSWELRKDWRERLELAGLDSRTLVVTGPYRWSLAWEQLTRRRTFRDDVQKQWIAQGREVPEATSYIRAFELPSPGEKRAMREKENKRFCDFLTPKIKARLRPGR
jgi:hypothetical protein